MKYILMCTVLLLLVNIGSAQQGSIGIGTETPNTNAVLDLVSPDKNQGFLVPRLTTAQRTASSFETSLSSVENGLLVFDSDLNQFYFWEDDAWTEIGTGASGNLAFDSLTGKLSVGGDTVSLGPVLNDIDSTNEIQDLQLSGTTLTITKNAAATPVDLSFISGGGSAQNLSLSADTLSITGGNSVFLPWAKGTGLTYFQGQRVGIGTSSPNQLLHIRSAADTAMLKIEAPGNSGNRHPILRFSESISTNDVGVDLYYNSQFDQLRVRTINNGTTEVDNAINVDRATGDLSVNKNFITPVTSSVLNVTSDNFTLTASDIQRRVILVRATLDGATIQQIDPGKDGQELILIGTSSSVGPVGVENSYADTSKRISLGSRVRDLNNRDSLSLIYVASLGYWIETSYVNIEELPTVPRSK